MSRADFDKMIAFFEHHKFDLREFKLENGVVIANKEKFAKSHLYTLIANRGKKTFIPYYKRLQKLYIHETKNTKNGTV